MIRRHQASRWIVAALSAATAGALLIAGLTSPAQAAAPRASISLKGAGSTFIGPLMLGGWIPGYAAKHSNVTIDYALTGSGTGISLWSAGTTDFAGSDALLKPDQEQAAAARCKSSVVKIPATIGAVALIYNLPGVKPGLKLTPDIIARIFLGQIHEWSDVRIRHLNPGVNLPMRPIQVVHRSDGSGTSYITTNYLAAVSPTWNSKVGAGSTVNWPVGIGAKGSGGVTAQVKQTQGAISYVDLAYAINAKLDYAQVQNKSGNYIAPSAAAASAAAASFAGSMPKDLQQVIVNSAAPTAYPISGYSYIFLCGALSGDKGRALVDFVHYAVTAGQMDAAPRYYAPLPPAVQAKDVAALMSIKVR